MGKAIHGTIHVCGPDGEELPPGQDGLIYFENAILPTYHTDPDTTADARHPNGWMTIGDIGHVDAEGYLYLTDRKSHMIISGGVNIYPQEVENLLVSHAKIGTSAIQTRATAGVANATYVFCLPGSPGACRDAWDEILVHQLDYRYRPCNFVEIMPRLDEHMRREKAQGSTV